MVLDVLKAIVLGVVEGLTEFIPVSSTGHLLLVEHFFGFGDDTFGKSFAILIQFGAVLALLSMAIGNIAAIAQSNIKRMLAYSAIAHMGFMLLGLLSGVVGGNRLNAGDEIRMCYRQLVFMTRTGDGGNPTPTQTG